MATYVNPFDFHKILVDYFLGTTQLVIFAFVLLYSFIGAKYGMSNRMFLSILAIGCLIMGVTLGNGIYVLIIFIIGLVVFSGLKRIVT